jgi:uncharacterized protein
MSQPALRGIYRYPVKSLRGEGLEQAALDARGIARDRHWMLVDPVGQFLSQRKLPRMTLVQTRLQSGLLTLQAGTMPDLQLAPEDPADEQVPVMVWGDECLARAAGEGADQWLSEFLQTDCRLVYLPEDQQRQVDLEYASQGDQTGFSDGFPLLLISGASLRDLNRRLAEPLPMERFCPNLVVDGCEPYAEDGWRRIRIGSTEFRVVKPCSRCAITTVNPDTAETGSEPLKTLNGYRRQGNKVYFGQNIIHTGAGQLSLGMEVEVLE